MEILKWGSNVPDLFTEPGAKYGLVSESLRHTFSAAKACSMFCGGRKCKYCDAAPLAGHSAWSDDQRVIAGLYSNWITDNILAMSRPSEYVNEKHNLVASFKQLVIHWCGIKTIINLQISGEHASCGPNPLLQSGFSYDPEMFMKKQFFYYNFGWQDYNVGSLTNILDMVKVMQFALTEGKVAVHCHAGLVATAQKLYYSPAFFMTGRTGVLIACYLIYANRVMPNEAITYIRFKRPNSIQTRSQVQCIQDFAAWIQPFRIIYPVLNTSAYGCFTLTQYLTRQTQLLHGYESRRLRYVPKIINICLLKLLELGHISSERLNNLIPKFTPSNLSIVTSDRPLTPQPKRQFSAGSTKHCVTVQSFTAVYSSTYTSELTVLTRSSSSSSSSSNFNSSSGDSEGTTLVNVVDALATNFGTNISTLLKCAVDRHKEILNNTGQWEAIENEEDPQVLSLLVWNWIETLKEPILHAQDLPLMLEFIDEPLTGLIQLEKGSHVTILHLITCIQMLTHKHKCAREGLLLRLIAGLTQQSHGGGGDGDWLISDRLSDSLRCFFVSLMTIL